MSVDEEEKVEHRQLLMSRGASVHPHMTGRTLATPHGRHRIAATETESETESSVATVVYVGFRWTWARGLCWLL
jgi:hypothetical protein